MSPRRPLPALAILLCAACGDPSAAEGTGHIELLIYGPEQITGPGQLLPFDVAVFAPRGVQPRTLVLTASGILSQTDTITLAGAAAQTVRAWYRLPDPLQAGEFTLDALATGSGAAVGSARVVLVATDDLPPGISLSIQPDTIVQPGDTLRIVASAQDNFALSRVVLTTTGAVAHTDTVLATERTLLHTFVLPVPRSAVSGTALTVAVTATDAGGRTGTAAPRLVHVRDLQDPTVAGELDEATPLALRGGQSLRFSVSGGDNVGLGWVGYTLSGAVVHADSVAVSGEEVSRNFVVPVAGHWAGPAALRAFVRDRSGRRSSVSLGGILVAGTSRPTSVRTFTLPEAATRAVVDAKRGWVFVSHRSTRTISIFDLATESFLPPIPIDGAPTALDVGPSGDTLVVALEGSSSIALVALDRVPLSARNVTLAGDREFLGNEYPRAVRVSSGGKALVLVSDEWEWASMYEYDLTRRIVRRRPDVPHYEANALLARSYDGGRIVLADDTDTRLYEAAADTFVRRAGHFSFEPDWRNASLDVDGGRIMLEGRVLDERLRTLADLTPSGYLRNNLRASVLAPGGYAAFDVGAGTLALVRMADGRVDRTVSLGYHPNQLLVLPDGSAIVAIGGTALTVVWLF